MLSKKDAVQMAKDIYYTKPWSDSTLAERRPEEETE